MNKEQKCIAARNLVMDDFIDTVLQKAILDGMKYTHRGEPPDMELHLHPNDREEIRARIEALALAAWQGGRRSAIDDMLGALRANGKR